MLTSRSNALNIYAGKPTSELTDVSDVHFSSLTGKIYKTEMLFIARTFMTQKREATNPKLGTTP